MAFVVTRPTPRTEILDGIRYTYYIVTEDVTTVTNDEWNVDVPDYGRLTLVEADLLGAGSAVTIQPAFGAAPGAGWVIDAVGHIDKAPAAAANIRLDTDKRFRSRDGKLYGRSQSDVDLDGTQTIVTLLTIAWGHVA